MSEADRTSGGVGAWYARVVRFALLRRLPRDPGEVPAWALTVPFQLWHAPYRYEGYSFEESHSGGLGPLARKLLPLRFFYLVFLLTWPLVAFVRALKRGRKAWAYFQGALRRPDLYVFFPQAEFSPQEVRWARPDYALAMFHAWEYVRTHADYFQLDDKVYFHETALREGFPVPRNFTAEEAMARGGDYVVKDPADDLGYGVHRAKAEELREYVGRDDLVIQERLRNHPVLREVYPPDAPLSSFRVLTLLDERGEPQVTRLAIRMGMDGADVDNTAQGGLWASITLDSGQICPAVYKRTFGREQGGKRLYETVHPDSGKTFAGVRIPWFEEGKQLALEAHRRLAPQALSLGWDVALAETGPCFLEVNVFAACYDYEPPNDAFTPACTRIVQRLAEGARGR